MNRFSELVAPLRRAVHAVCFETGIQDAPFGTLGTCFFVELKCGFFAVTLEHVLKQTHVSDMFVFEEGNQIKQIRFEVRINVTCPASPDSEIRDLVLLKISRSTLSGHLPFYNLSKISNEWELEPWNYEYMVFGYPSEGRYVDYENKHIHCPQHSFTGVYSGKSMLEDCYKLTITPESNSGPSNIDGYSLSLIHI